MGKVVPFLPILGLSILALAGCALPDTRWVKPGADAQATASDIYACRRAAEQESYNSPTFISPVWAGRHWSQAEADRFYDESRLANFCMRNKGYALVTVPPQPQVPAAVAPADK